MNLSPLNGQGKEMTFWEHLDELRGVLIRIIICISLFALIAFWFKDELFSIILAPKESDFPTYRLLDLLGSLTGSEALSRTDIDLINTGLARQFSLHLQASLFAGMFLASPYIIYALFGFISPGLYTSERKIVWRVLSWAYIMFILGVGVCYFLIFPLTFQFLGTYQVSASVANMISIDSYMETFVLMSLMMGVMFELPVVAYFLGKAGILSSKMLRTYRRHAFLFLLIAAALITPTGDAVTLLAVTLPVYLLYEVSIRLLPDSQTETSST